MAEQTEATTEAAGGHQEAVHETLLGIDSYGVVGLAFLTFILILWKAGVFRSIGGALDAHAEKVRSDLAEAAQLKADAEAIKAKAAAEAAEAEAQAQATLANAQAEAQRIVVQAGIDAETVIARRTKLAEDRIAVEVRNVEAELRARAADVALKAAESVLSARSKELGSLTDTAIAGLDQR